MAVRFVIHTTRQQTHAHIQRKNQANRKKPMEEISQLEFNACIIYRDHGVGGLFSLKYAKMLKRCAIQIYGNATCVRESKHISQSKIAEERIFCIYTDFVAIRCEAACVCAGACLLNFSIFLNSNANPIEFLSHQNCQMTHRCLVGDQWPTFCVSVCSNLLVSKCRSQSHTRTHAHTHAIIDVSNIK